MDFGFTLCGTTEYKSILQPHASMKHFTGALRAFIFEVFMFLTFVTT
jgi:hypothetical protein